MIHPLRRDRLQPADGACPRATTPRRRRRGRSTCTATASCWAKAPACSCWRSWSTPEARGATIYAELTGYGSTGDAFRVTDCHPEGRGAIACMRRALADARLSPEQIGYINAHGTSTRVNDLRRDAGHQEGLRRARVPGADLVEQEHARPPDRRRRRGRTGHLRPGDPPTACCRRRSTTRRPTRSAISTTSRTCRARARAARPEQQLRLRRAERVADRQPRSRGERFSYRRSTGELATLVAGCCSQPGDSRRRFAGWLLERLDAPGQ